MRLSLDVSAVPAKPAGAGRYIYELARQLASLDDPSTTFVSRTDDLQRWRDLGAATQVSNVVPDARPARLLWEQLRFPSVLKNLGVDVHHSPHYTMPERASVPVVVTIHDMTLFDHPEWHERSKVFVFRRAITNAVKRAAHLVAVSEDTAMRLRARFGEVPVTVIPHGIDHSRFNPIAQANEVEALQAIGVPDEYIAFVGTVEPRKNVPLLIKAFDKLAAGQPSLHLVIAGQRGWMLQEFDDALSNAKHGDRVIVTGYVSEPMVPAILRHARAVVYPSHIEGFGLPALEALACGAPLVAATGSAVQEVVGDAAILVNSQDVDELCDAITRALKSDREDARRRGEAVAARYTWQETAKRHIEVYRKVK